MRKTLVKTLILSKISYCDIVIYPLPNFLITRLQKLQFAMASFVVNRYVNKISTIMDLGWLPMKEHRDFSLLKTVHKSLYNDNWPSYLQLEISKPVRNLRSNTALKLVTPFTPGTFQYSAATLFNSLPPDTRNCTVQILNYFVNHARPYLNRALLTHASLLLSFINLIFISKM